MRFWWHVYGYLCIPPLAPPAAPKCADVTELMGLKEGNLLLWSGRHSTPKYLLWAPPLPMPIFCVCLGFFAQTLTYTVYAYLHVLRLTHLCMHWADKYCGSFSPWQSTVKNWGVIIALGGGWCGNTRMAKYAWLPPKLQCCVMKYGCCRRGLPCNSFLVTFSLAFFLFSFPCSLSLFGAGIFIFACPLPSS